MADDDKCPGKDMLTLGPDLGNGLRPFVRHRSDHTIEAGTARAAKDGEPLNTADVVHLHHRGPGPLYEVEPLYEHARTEEEDSSGGPAMVNSEAYRNGWEQIFGPQTVGEA